ncbi:protein-export membrane protein SecF [Longispora fulva]|uniref:Protein-export membrane protein SecF n=1 Tax=Longispora fulva TaxID=619741 RepID=A0A8J7H0S5_9ACTN|nr:preprotein translocase subunit SecF [Longispora fulva]GIG59060.1 protein-export membrane protein SecF [Longispora fulva]
MAGLGLATRLYRGDAGLNIIGKKKVWFSVALTVLLITVLSFVFRGPQLGIDFTGGNKFQVPASVGDAKQVESAIAKAVTDVDPKGKTLAAVKIGGGEASYEVKTTSLNPDQSFKVKTALAQKFGIDVTKISDTQVSGAWGSQVTSKALTGLAVFLAIVIGYLVIRFEWRMAIGAVASLILDLTLTAGVYLLVGFEITPSTVIGFLTILGFALYDVVVVFDKVQENTGGILARNTMTYPEAANLAVNQTLMRSINTGLVALLPVGGLLFIGAGLLGAGTLKDLGLVLFIGMGAAVYSSIFFATPVLVWLKEKEGRVAAHTQRVFARRASLVEKGEDGVPTPRVPVFVDGGTLAPKPGQRPVSRPRKR